MFDLEKEAKTPGKKVEPRGYLFSPNYKGKNPHVQNTMEALPAKQERWENGSDFTAEACRNLWTEKTTSKGAWMEKGKIMANQTMAMTVDLAGRKGIISPQSMKCTSQVENKKEPENTLQSNKEEPEYSPQSDEEEPEYSPQYDEEFDDDM